MEKPIVYLAGASGKLGTKIHQALQGHVSRVLMGGKNRETSDYELGFLNNTYHPSIGIIATAPEGVQMALTDFIRQRIPTILATTATKISESQMRGVPLLQAPNLALPIISLMKIFFDFEDFSGMSMKVQESHQAGKKDPSGTAMKLIKLFKQKSGKCEVKDEETYNPSEGRSELGDLICVRGNASRDFGVSQNFLPGHAYHTYEIAGNGERFEQLRALICDWIKKYPTGSYSGFSSSLQEQEGNIIFSHNIDGRAIYGQGLVQVLPWFMKQEQGIYGVEEFICD